MIRAERLTVGEEPVDLTEGSGGSGVSIQWLRNSGTRSGDLLVGGDENGERPIPLGPGETLPTGITLGSTDRLHVRSATKRAVAVDVILGWT